MIGNSINRVSPILGMCIAIRWTIVSVIWTGDWKQSDSSIVGKRSPLIRSTMTVRVIRRFVRVTSNIRMWMVTVWLIVWMNVRLDIGKIPLRFLISVWIFHSVGKDLIWRSILPVARWDPGISNGNNVTRSMMVVTTRNIIWKTHGVCLIFGMQTVNWYRENIRCCWLEIVRTVIIGTVPSGKRMSGMSNYVIWS